VADPSASNEEPGSSAKDELRSRMLELREAIPPEGRQEAAGAVAGHLGEIPGFAEAGTVLLYYSVGSELPIMDLIVQLVEGEGRRVLLPFVMNDRLEAAEWRPSDPTTQGDYVGVQPRFHRPVPPEEVDAALVPGLAFDRGGGRVGSGRGLHDGLLSRLRPEAIVAGLAFAEQVVDEVPRDEGDVAVAFVVTPDGVTASS
jgi:5-formyltetrahydrofolate cyclo-ligase